MRLAIALALLGLTASLAGAQTKKPSGPYETALSHHANGRIAQALASYTQALRTNPRQVNAYINRGVCYHAQGNHQRALADYSRALQLDPTAALAWNNRGIVLQKLGRVPGAISGYTQAITMSAPKGDWHFNRATAKQASKDLAGAMRDYDLAIGQDEVYAEAHYNRGTILQQQNNAKGAKAAFEAAVKHATPKPKKTGPVEVDAKKVGALIKQLGSSVWKERDGAQKALLKIGKPALPLLRKALESKDLEVRNRAQQIIDKLTGKGKPFNGRLRNAASTLKLAKQALAELKTSPAKVQTPIPPQPEPADLEKMGSFR